MNAFQEDWQIPGHWFDYYECLGIKKDASDAEIKSAYRKLAKENHPDLNPGDKEKEEKFKKINIAYEILSNEYKRKEYDRDYDKRMGNSYTNTNTSQSRSSSSNTRSNSSQNSNTTSNTGNNNYQNNNAQKTPMDFDTLASEYRRNSNDKRIFRNLKSALDIIINSYEDYAKLVDDTYQELFSCLFNKEISKEEYVNSSDELKVIIIEQIKNISEFKNNNSFLFNDRDFSRYLGRVYSIINEYNRKNDVLNKKRFILFDFSKNFFKDELKRFSNNEYLFNRVLKEKIDPINSELDKLEDDVLNKRISIDLFDKEINNLSVSFNEVKDWLNLVYNISCMEINIDFLIIAKRNLHQHKLNDIVSLKKDVEDKIQVQELLNLADNLINEIGTYKYDNIQELYEKIKNNTITMGIYDDLLRKINSFRKMVMKIGTSKYPILRGKLDEINILLESNNFLVNYNWDDLLVQISMYEKDSRYTKLEEKAKEFLKEVEPIVEFVRNLVVPVSTYKDLLNSQTFAKIDSYENQINKIKNEIESMYGYEEKSRNIASAAYGLRLDLENLDNVFKYYKKFVNKMVAYEDYLSICDKDISKLNVLFSDLQRIYNISIRENSISDKNNEDYTNKINEILNIFDSNNSNYSKIETLTFQAIREGRETFVIDEFKNAINYCFTTRRKMLPRNFNTFFYGMNLESYNKYRVLKNQVESWIKSHSIENIKKDIVFNKINKIIKEFPTMLKKSKFVINISSINNTDWDLVKVEKEKLVQTLEELNQLLLVNSSIFNEEESKKYWKFYQNFKSQCESISVSKVEVITKLKMQTLQLLKSSQVSKKKINESETVNDEYLNDYINNLFDYHMNVLNIKLIDNQDEKFVLTEKVKVYEIILGELSNLRSKNSNVLVLEKKYREELEEIQKQLFFKLHEGKSKKYLEYLWKKSKLEQNLSNSNITDEVFLEYLELVGEIAKEEYLSVHPLSEDELSNSIREIEANIASLVAKKNVIVNNNSMTVIDRDKTLNDINSMIDEYNEQLLILKL